jgi:hypothetical protein
MINGVKKALAALPGDRRVRHSLYFAEGAPYVFVRVLPGPLWIRTDICVAIVACPACGSEARRPCVDKQGVGRTSTHYLRKQAARVETAKKAQMGAHHGR